jgi:hypothetical protein
MIAWPTGQRGSWREVIAIPAALREHSNMQRIVSEVDSSTPDQREFLVGALLALAGLRGLEETVEQEIRNTPALIDILENKVLGREFKKGLQEGRQEGELAILRQQIEKRFGALPSWAEQRLAGASTEQLEGLATHVLDAANLEELLGSASV